MPAATMLLANSLVGIRISRHDVVHQCLPAGNARPEVPNQGTCWNAGANPA
jgi:hypothetical protein